MTEETVEVTVTAEDVQVVLPGLDALKQAMNEARAQLAPSEDDVFAIITQKQQMLTFLEGVWQRACLIQAEKGGPDIFNWQLVAKDMATYHLTYSGATGGVGWDVVATWLAGLRVGSLLARRKTEEEKAADEPQSQLIIPEALRRR